MLAALSMLAKETGLTVVLFNIIFDLYSCWSHITKSATGTKWRWKGDVSGRVVKLILSLSLLAGLRLMLLHGSLPAFSPQDNPPAFHPSFIVRLLTFCYLAAFNWWLLLCPWTLSHDWQMGSIPLVTSLLDPRNLLTGAAVIALLALTYACWIDFEYQRHTPAVVGLLLLVIPYLPASNLFVTVGFVIAERVLYMPSIGSVIITSYGLQLLWQRRDARRWLIVGMMILVAGGVARTHLRNADWMTKETLLRADLAVLPHNAKLHYNFGNFLKDIEQQENAIKHYKEALRLWPSYASAHNNLGTLVVASGKAEYHFLQALKYNRDHVNAHYNLGKLYRKKNRIPESLKMLERCISLEPRFVQAYLELLFLKPEEEKRYLLQKILELEPNNWEHHLLYGNWLKGKGFNPPATKYFLEAMRLTFKTRSHRGDLVSLRSTCLLLRDLGQHARILQLITRWQSHRGGAGRIGARNLLLREWRLRAELAGRARLYSRTHAAAAMSTCLHHSQLEVSPEPYNSKATSNDNTQDKINTIYWNSANDVEKILIVNRKSNGCQKPSESGTKKGISISTLYKPIHNKSESGLKQKSCPLHKKKAIKESEDFNPYMSDHLIKTY